MRNTIIICIVVAALGVFGAWLYSQPGKALSAVQTAMDRDDPALLAPWLDLAALRSNIKNREATKLPEGMSKGGPGGFLGLLGQALAESFIGALVQGMATPEGLLAVLRGAAANALEVESKTPHTPSERLFGHAKTELIGFDRYVVSAPMKDGTLFKLVFARQGTEWKMSDLEIVTASGENT